MNKVYIKSLRWENTYRRNKEMDLELSLFTTNGMGTIKSPEQLQLALEDAFTGNVIVKCQHCAQWAAAKTSCWACGAPVDP